MLLAHGVLLSDRHEDELAQDALAVVRELHGASGVGIGSDQLSADDLGMLEDGAEVLDADDDVELVLDLNLVKLLHLDGDVGVQRLLQNSFLPFSSDSRMGRELEDQPSLLLAPFF